MPAEIGRFPGHCNSCGGRPELVIQIDLKPVMLRLDRIERLVRKEGKLIMTDIHGEIAEQLTPVLDAVQAVDTNVARALTDFANKVAPKLSDDEKAEFAGLAQNLLDLNAQIDVADPQPTEPPVEG